ncbi:PAS domain S-box protein [Rhodoferax sp. PAMC 29310]|uniref:sensor histidine kinase n=1 Tax=Rhodoferax sp. PAMC 29310 TaxID=2822760 RepID=UPI001B31926F|nr:PAS domain S-box protein [Rhodoferax sp. PAMC 29310]
MKLLARLNRKWRRVYSLNTILLFSAFVVLVLAATAYSTVLHHQLETETLKRAKSWADSVAELVATANATALIVNDMAVIETNLRGVAWLPSIQNVAIFRADGGMLMQLSRTGNQIESQFAGDERMDLPHTGVKALPSGIKDTFYETWSGVDAGATFPKAWVRIQFSLQERNEEMNLLTSQILLDTILLIGGVLLGLHLIVSRAIRPLRDLSVFAEKTPSNMGAQITTDGCCFEVNQLALALNQASHSAAEQIGRMGAILNTAAEAIVGLDAKGVIVTVNQAAISFFGRAEDALIALSFDACIPGLGLPALQKMFDDSAGGYAGASRVVRHDLFGSRADGTLFPVEVSLGRVERDNALCYVCIFRDVTDERASQGFTELYERALDCSHNAVFITNGALSHQPIVYVNEAFQSLEGEPAYKVLGTSLADRIGMSSDAAGRRELTRAVAEQRNANVTLFTDLADGKQRVTEISLSPVLSSGGVLTNFIGIVSDVTARVQAVAAIAERRAQLDAIFSLSPDGFVVFDSNEKMVFANPAFERMTGLSWVTESALPTLDDFLVAMTLLCDDAQILPCIQLDAEDGMPWRARLQLIRPQMRVLMAESRRNTGGQDETILYFRDITHEDEVDRIKSEFLAAAAHELRTPMVSIFGFTELLLKRQFTEERRADMLETIHRQSGFLIKMLNELLDLSRIESRLGLDLEIAAHSLEELVSNSVKGLMRTDTDRQVLVGVVPKVAVLIDPEKMQLVMNNLLSNAFKYSPGGGDVTLNARLDQADSVHYAVIDIRDHGIGMTPEQINRAFDRFYRADASGHIPGTGLGLSMVKEVVGLHKGRVELASESGKGTTVSVWTPLANAVRVTGERSVAGAGEVHEFQ